MVCRGSSWQCMSSKLLRSLVGVVTRMHLAGCWSVPGILSFGSRKCCRSFLRKYPKWWWWYSGSSGTWMCLKTRTCTTHTKEKKRKEKLNASITYSLQVTEQFESMTQLSDPRLKLLGLGRIQTNISFHWPWWHNICSEEKRKRQKKNLQSVISITQVPTFWSTWITGLRWLQKNS